MYIYVYELLLDFVVSTVDLVTGFIAIDHRTKLFFYSCYELVILTEIIVCVPYRDKEL